VKKLKVFKEMRNFDERKLIREIKEEKN